MKNLLLIVFLLAIGSSIQSDVFAKGANESAAIATLRAVVVDVDNGVWVAYVDGRTKTVSEINNTGSRTFKLGETVNILVVKPKSGEGAAC